MINKELFEQEESIFQLSDLSNINECKSIYVSQNFEQFNIDFIEFRHLKHLRCDLPYKFRNNIGVLSNLEQLILFNINDKRDDLSKLHKLEFLTLTRGNIQNLEFTKSMQVLKSIELNMLSKLSSIVSLEDISDQIIHLEIDSCKKIQNLGNTIGKLKNLEILKLINLEIEDIEWIKNLTKLKQFIAIDSNIKSGNITPAQGIEYVAIDNKRHYNFHFDFESKRIYAK